MVVNRYYIVLAVSAFLCFVIYLNISNSYGGTTSETTPHRFLTKSHITDNYISRRPIPLPRNTSTTFTTTTTAPLPLTTTPPRLNSITDKFFYPQIGKIKPPAVILRTKGGTGNQLFEYACHYSIARKNDWPLYVMMPNDYNTTDRTWDAYRRDFVLDQFHIPLYEYNMANDKSWTITDAEAVSDFQMLSGEYPLNKVIQQSGGDYCQSESFFAPYKEELLEYFVQNIDLEPIKEWVAKIDSTQESVAVHVRRGDFIRLNVSAPMSFYRDCMKRIVDRLEGRQVAFFLFSDDIGYVEKNLYPPDNDFPNKFEIYIVTDEKKTNSLQELSLMSRCKHQIIADSTFSWWGAYLNRNPNKIVYAAHYRSSTVANIYPESTHEKYIWEFRNVYYPVNWNAIEPEWDDSGN